MNQSPSEGWSLFNHISAYVRIEEQEYEEISSYFSLKRIKKKELLTRGGERCLYNFYIIKGCMHMFFVDDRGKEKTIQFAIDDWWITDHLAFLKERVSEFCIQALEDTEVLSISKGKQEELLNSFPKLEKYFRTIYQISYGAALMKMKYLYGLSKEEIYFHFIEQFPEFAQRVPQYVIASFLDLTPEYVSEIRKKKRS